MMGVSIAVKYTLPFWNCPCYAFQAAANVIGSHIDEREAAKILVQEPELTAMLLEQVYHTCPKTVHHKQIGIQEKTSGADWEWWIMCQGQWLGFRIQAKRYDPVKKQFGDIDHLVGLKKVRQVDLLLNGCKADRLLPLYVFYSGAKHGQKVNCCPAASVSNISCCSVAMGSAIERLVSLGKTKAADVLPYCSPLACLPCCQPAYGPSALQTILRNYFSLAEPEGTEHYVSSEVIRDTPPNYITAFLESNSLPDGAPVDELLITDLEDPDNIYGP